MTVSEVERRIGYRFRSRSLLDEALRHASTLGHGSVGGSYQRLEYLGDAVLNLCVAEEMFRRMPGAAEGTLSKARSGVINNRNLLRVGERIGVPSMLRTDPSVRTRGGGVTRKMVADVVEALAGAIFLDGGYEPARRFVLAHFWAGETEEETSGRFDSKSRLQEWCQARRRPLPRYRLVEEAGPPHARRFTVLCRAGGGYEAAGSGKTKKEAEMEAADAVLGVIEAEERG